MSKSTTTVHHLGCELGSSHKGQCARYIDAGDHAAMVPLGSRPGEQANRTAKALKLADGVEPRLASVLGSDGRFAKRFQASSVEDRRKMLHCVVLSIDEEGWDAICHNAGVKRPSSTTKSVIAVILNHRLSKIDPFAGL